MKNKKKIFVFLTFMFLPFINVKADCDYNRQIELNQIASNVKAYYQVSEEPELYFTIYIFNLTEDIYAEVKSDDSLVSKQYYYSKDNKGIVSFDNYFIYNKNDYYISIRSLDTSCSTSNLRTINITTPRYNPNYNTSLCMMYREYSFCSKWYEYDLTFEEVKERIEESEQRKKVEESKSKSILFEFIKKYYLVITIVALVIVSLIVIKIIRKKRKEIF